MDLVGEIEESALKSSDKASEQTAPTQSETIVKPQEKKNQDDSLNS